MILPAFPSIAWHADADALAAAATLKAGLCKYGIKQEVAASVMGLTFRDLNEQLACRKPMNYFRLRRLFKAYPDLRNDLYTSELEADGFKVIRDVVLLKMVDALQMLATGQRRPVLKASLLNERESA